ncbi:MAG: MerR family transcriptional regulator [Chloracidobacterium sp.]
MTIEELCQATAHELARRGLATPQPDGRVTDAPDERTVRYYQTLGLLPRPSVLGRKSCYAAVHVQRLLAIKALQRQGWSLAKIQQWLVGRTDEELHALIDRVSESVRSEGQSLPTTVWREVTLLPGLKLLAATDWSPPVEDTAALEALFRAALAMLRTAHPGSPGGRMHEPANE